MLMLVESEAEAKALKETERMQKADEPIQRMLEAKKAARKAKREASKARKKAEKAKEPLHVVGGGMPVRECASGLAPVAIQAEK